MNDFALMLRVQEIARRVAHEEIMPRFHRVSASVKADGGLLTEADIASQQALMQLLPQVAPYPVLGEEMPASTQQSLWAANQDGLWVVDPLDGTTNFARGLPCFSVSIALMRAGRPTLGVVYAPMQNECFAAVLGGGAWCNDVMLCAEEGLQLARAVAAIETKRLPAELAVRVVSERPFYSQRNFGAATLDWCWLAAGRADVMLHGAQKLWDFAAGSLILQEAGGCIATLESNDFWAATPWQRSILAARTPELFAQWHDWVHRRRLSAI